MAPRIPRFLVMIPSAALFIVAAVALAIPQPAPSMNPECPAIDLPTATRPVAPAGVRAFIDPVTGKLRRPTPEERQKLASTVSRDRSGRAYEVRIEADGTRIVQLDETFMMSVVAVKNPDGTISYRCRSDRSPAGGAGLETGK